MSNGALNNDIIPYELLISMIRTPKLESSLNRCVFSFLWMIAPCNPEAIPTFELLDLNFIDNDSQVLIDNVSINPVPEPATLSLLALGALALLRRRRRR